LKKIIEFFRSKKIEIKNSENCLEFSSFKTILDKEKIPSVKQEKENCLKRKPECDEFNQGDKIKKYYQNIFTIIFDFSAADV
jgi:hypothetical protein